MSDQRATPASFVASSIKPIQAARAYLLNKPCVRCYRSTNIRVHLPTCSHRICSTCLSEFAGLHGKPDPINCPTCSTYWFTPLPECKGSKAGVNLNNDTSLHNERRGRDIERQICAQDQQHEAVAIIMEPDASPNIEMISERSYTPSNKSSQSLITACESSELSDADSLEYQKCQADLDLRTARVQEQWRAFRAGLQESMTEAKREQLLNDRCEEDDSINPKHLNLEGMDLKAEGVYELEATESQTTGTSSGGAYELEAAKTQNNGNNAPESVFSAERTPLIGTLPADVEIFQTQHETFVPTITNDETVGPAYSLIILLVLVYLFFEFASSIAQALASYLGLVK